MKFEFHRGDCTQIDRDFTRNRLRLLDAGVTGRPTLSNPDNHERDVVCQFREADIPAYIPEQLLGDQF